MGRWCSDTGVHVVQCVILKMMMIHHDSMVSWCNYM